MNATIFTVTYQGKQYHLSAERTNLFADYEIWRIKARNRTFVMECDRPGLMKKSLDSHRWGWRLKGGDCPLEFQQAMQDALEAAIRQG